MSKPVKKNFHRRFNSIPSSLTLGSRDYIALTGLISRPSGTAFRGGGRLVDEKLAENVETKGAPLKGGGWELTLCARQLYVSTYREKLKLKDCALGQLGI